MRIGAQRAKDVTLLLRAAVQAQIECWGYQSRIERKLGVYFGDMERGVQDLAAAGDPETIDHQEVQEFIAKLRVEEVTRRRAAKRGRVRRPSRKPRRKRWLKEKEP